jgi:hypothetical protein
MFRISLLLWLIALAALNLTLLRYSEAVIDLSPKFAGLIGLMRKRLGVSKRPDRQSSLPNPFSRLRSNIQAKKAMASAR